MKRLCLLAATLLALSVGAGDLVAKEDFEDVQLGPFYGRKHWSVPGNGEIGIDIVNAGEPQRHCLKMLYDDATVYRSIFESYSATTYSNVTDDVVFDAKIQFTANFDLSVPELDRDSKFAIWLYGEGETTNLYVTAGGNTSRSGYNTPTNYCIGVAGVDFSVDNWYRVTVRAIRNVSKVSSNKGDMMGFTVFIDEKQAACLDDDYQNKITPIFNPTEEATYYIERQQLFPSILSAGNDPKSSRLAALGLLGTGMADDISIADADDFTFTAKPVLFTIEWGEGVERFNFTTNGYEDVVAESGPGSLTLNLTGLDVTDTILVTNIVRTSGWEGEEFVVAAIGDGSLTVGAEYPGDDTFDVDGIKYTTLVDAVNNVGDGGMVKLLRDGVVEDIGKYSIKPERSFTLDLAGKHLTVSSQGGKRTVFYLGNSVMATSATIISSIAGGTIDVTGARSLFQVENDSSAIIGSPEEEDAGVAVKGSLLSDRSDYGVVSLSAVKGFFTDGGVSNCLYRSTCSETPDDLGYWVVTPKDEEDEPMAFGDEKEYDSEAEAQAAVEAAQGGITVAWPKNAGDAPESWSDGGQAAYSALFTLAQDGKVVRVELKPADDDAIKAVEESLTEATRKIDLGGAAASVEVDSVPGLYYGVSIGEELDAMSVDEWSIATSNKVQVAIPARDATKTSGFYRLEANPTK